MAKAIFNRRFDATDTTRGVSIRIEASPEPQDFPKWAIDLAVEKGAAELIDKPTASAKADQNKKDG